MAVLSRRLLLGGAERTDENALQGLDRLLDAVERLSCIRCLAETLHPLGRMLRPCEVCGGTEWLSTQLADELNLRPGQISGREFNACGQWDDLPPAA